MRQAVFYFVVRSADASVELIETWAAQAAQKDTEGGNYYATQAAYLGEHYLKLVLGKHYQGRISLDQVADYLGVKPKNVAGLEEFAFQGATPA